MFRLCGRSEQTERDHAGRMELKRLAAEFRVTVLLAEVIALLGEERLVDLVRDGLHDPEVPVRRLCDLHAVVRDYVDRIVPHLTVDARSVSGTYHDALVLLF